MKIYYDLHIHSGMSPCADEEMTPNNIVNMAKLCGLDVIAVSDHNSGANVEAIINVAKKLGELLVIPAMELTTADDIHVLLYFHDLQSCIDCSNDVYKRLRPIKNKKEIFGRQLYFDEFDKIIKEEEILLITATDITIDNINDYAKKYNAVAIPAHIDKEANGLLSILGGISLDMGFKTVELSPNSQQKHLTILSKDSYNILYNSDAHYLENINENAGKNFLEVDKLTVEAVLLKLKNESE